MAANLSCAKPDGFFVVSVLINPFLPQIRLKPVAALPQQSDINFHPPELPALTKRETIAKQTAEKAKLEALKAQLTQFVTRSDWQ